MKKYTHIGRLFYLGVDVPIDVTEVTMTAGGVDVKAKRLFWRFYWALWE